MFTRIVGVDPGLVHTGVVELTFDEHDHEIITDHAVIQGYDAAKVSDWVYRNQVSGYVFTEAYRTRSSFNTDDRMVVAVRNIHAAMYQGKVIDNTGIKKVVRRPLMELLGVWLFATPTHHGDLRSAARIALLGMLRHDGYNQLLTKVVQAHLMGRTWPVIEQKNSASTNQGGTT